jgi:protease PrsW
MVGLGFALAENVVYYVSTVFAGGPEGLGRMFTMRAMLSPLAHPLFTSMAGIGLGLSRESGRRTWRLGAPAAGLAMAMGLHALWNASAALGVVAFAVYVLVVLPAYVAALVAVLGVWRAPSGAPPTADWGGRRLFDRTIAQ